MNKPLLRFTIRRFLPASALLLLVGMAGVSYLFSERPWIRFPAQAPLDDSLGGAALQVGEVDRLAAIDSFDAPRPLGLDITPDGSKLCVVQSILSNADPRGGVSLIDLESGSVSSVLISENRPEEERFGRTVDAAVSPDGIFCFISVSGSVGGSITGALNRVEVVRIDSDVPVIQDPILLDNSVDPFGPLELDTNPAGTRLYVADRGNLRLHVIDIEPGSATRFQQLASVGTQGAATDVAVTPDGSRVYVANRIPSTVACVDAATNTVGAGACQGIGIIPTSVGPSGSSGDIAMSPDGTLACVVYNLGQPCVACIDTDPGSLTFNQQTRLIPTTGERLEEIAFDPNGSRVFVASRDSNEMLVVDLENGQEQRVGVGVQPNDLVAFDGRIFTSNSGDQTVIEVGPFAGPFLQPVVMDTRTGDAFSDESTRGGPDCEDLPRNGLPDLGADDRIVLTRQGNRIRGFRVSRPEEAVEVAFSDPHPVTGQFQSGVITPPDTAAAASNQGLINRSLSWIGQKLGVSMPIRHRFFIDGYDPRFRPSSITIETEMGDPEQPTVIESRIVAMDEDGDGLTEDFLIDAVDFFPRIVTSPVPHDVGGGGSTDYVGFPYNAAGFQYFLPLGDTDGDGTPDTPALDLNRDGRPDADLPLFPFVAGPANPTASLDLHFAQFGDGGGDGGGPSIFSQIVLFNLDRQQAADATVFLTGDDGSPLSVDLNGNLVEGETSLSIPAGGLSILRTDGQGPLVAGSVTVTSDRAVAGVILFGGTTGLAGVGSSPVLESGFVAALQRREAAGINTGIALKNLESGQVALNLTLSDADGSVLARFQLALPGGGHRALFVTEIAWQPEPGVVLDLSDFAGSVRVESEGRLAATVLQTRPGELATLPVAPDLGRMEFGPSFRRVAARGTAGSRRDETLSFAQFGDGGGLSSQIVLLNRSSTTADVAIDLRDGAGDPLSVDLSGQVVAGRLELEIPGGALRILETDGQGELAVGSVQVSSDVPLAGVIVFSGPAGVAGVGNSSLLRRGFEAPMETSQEEGLNTGIAVMNLEDEAATLQLRLIDENGAELATAEESLPPRGQRALFVNEFDWSPVQDFSSFRGLLSVSASGQTAATVIQSRPGVFSTQPVVPSLNP